MLALITLGAPLVGSTLNGIWLWGWHKPSLRPCWTHASVTVAKALLAQGSLFLALQVASAVYFGLDNLIISHSLGASYVTEYSVANKLFSFFPPLLGMFFGSLWPAYGEAQARGDMAWVRRTFFRSLRISIALGLGVSVFLAILARPIIKVWVGNSAMPSVQLAIGLGAWALVWCALGNLSALLNGLNRISFQAGCFLALLLLGLPLKLLLAQKGGLPGVVWATTIATLTCFIIPSGCYLRKVLYPVVNQEPA